MNPAALFDLSGRTALVTGARAGIGRMAAETLAAANADIVGLGSRTMPDTARSIRSMGRDFREIVVDLEHASPDDLKEVVDQAVPDIVVNNAGIIRRAPLLDFSEEDWDAVIAVNLKSLFFLAKAAAQSMRARQVPGRIINIGSLLSVQGGIRVVAYTAAKHGVVGVTRAMANELAPHGITVNAILPGYIETDNTEALRADAERSRDILGRIPVGRWGKPDDIATALLFLASPASGYVTGSAVAVDGGWLSR